MRLVVGIREEIYQGLEESCLTYEEFKSMEKFNIIEYKGKIKTDNSSLEAYHLEECCEELYEIPLTFKNKKVCDHMTISNYTHDGGLENSNITIFCYNFQNVLPKYYRISFMLYKERSILKRCFNSNNNKYWRVSIYETDKEWKNIREDNEPDYQSRESTSYVSELKRKLSDTSKSARDLLVNFADFNKYYTRVVVKKENLTLMSTDSMSEVSYGELS